MDVTPSEDRRLAPSSKHNGAGVPQAQISLKEATLPSSRRHFFRGLVCDGVTAASTAYLVSAGTTHLTAMIPEGERAEVIDLARYPNTNVQTSLPSGVSFHNLGVVHTGLRFMVVRDTIERAIRDSDVVLLEGCAGQTYFDFVSAMAHHHRKVVLRLESGKSQVHDIGFTTAAVLVIYTGASNIFHFLNRGFSALSGAVSFIRNRGEKRGRGDRDEYVGGDGPSIGRTLFTVGTSLNHYAFGLSEHALRYDRTSGQYPIRDGSYTMDGRTVLMLKDIERCVTEFSNLRVLAITGDLHARGFAYYASSPERYEVYQQRAEWYETLYRSWLGGRPKIEFDPALTGRETPVGT
jgi:hypothetical protein